MRMLSLIAAVLVCAAPLPAEEEAAKPLRVLFLSKSAGFEHSVIKETDGQPSHAAKALAEVAAAMGATLKSTKDASLINTESLKDYDVLIFYTTGDLTETGTDGHPAMAPTGVDDLLAWIHGGGGFVGIHCASDTFHAAPEAPATPYLEMVGGEFLTHGRQFKGTLKVTDPEHPTMAAIEDGWTLLEEWYIFRNLNKEKMRVLALLDPSAEAKRDERYNVPPYPMIWCREYGNGRVFFNGMGHREDVWDHAAFRQHLADAIRWAGGEGETRAEPNYAEVVPPNIAKTE